MTAVELAIVVGALVVAWVATMSTIAYILRHDPGEWSGVEEWERARRATGAD